MSNKFNMKDVEIGDTVHFRCGGSAVVGGVGSGFDLGFPISFGFSKNSKLDHWKCNGAYKDYPLSLFDILKVTRPASVTVVMERE